MTAIEHPKPRGPVTQVQVTRVQADDARRRRDRVASEEPLEIRAAGPGQRGISVAVTMRTPGNDFELAAGFLFTEGLLTGPDEIASIRYCADVVEQEYNVVTVDLRRPFDASRLQRNFYATSSCGVCGKASIDQIEVACAAIPAGPTVTSATIVALPDRLRDAQGMFESTGGIHASGLFTADGAPVTVREDVGRHNAMDKLIGERLLAGATPLHDHIALVSGRASFELVQKAAVAGVPIVCAISAPSSLAIETAHRLGLTLVGFLRGDRFNMYTHPERIALS